MKICIIGTGYVGLVTGTCFAEIGNNVICVDNNEKKIANLKSNIIPIYEPGLKELIQRNSKQNRLKFTTDIKYSIRKSDIIFICVGTPSNKKNNEANLKYVYKVINSIKQNANKYKVVVTKSTVPVTTGDKIEKIFQATDQLRKAHRIAGKILSKLLMEQLVGSPLDVLRSTGRQDFGGTEKIPTQKSMFFLEEVSPTYNYASQHDINQPHPLTEY